MSAWNYLFGREPENRDEKESIERQAAHQILDEMIELRNQVRDYRHHIDRLELVCEALVGLLEHHAVINREELILKIQRLDLSDGIEDEKIDYSSLLEKHKCPFCLHPINPRRERCIYCFAPLQKENKST